MLHAGYRILRPSHTGLKGCNNFLPNPKIPSQFFDEIFVLEGPRSVVRLSRQPDRFQTLEDNRLLVESGANTLGEDAPEGQGQVSRTRF